MPGMRLALTTVATLAPAPTYAPVASDPIRHKAEAKVVAAQDLPSAIVREVNQTHPSATRNVQVAPHGDPRHQRLRPIAHARIDAAAYRRVVIGRTSTSTSIVIKVFQICNKIFIYSVIQLAANVLFWISANK